LIQQIELLCLWKVKQILGKLLPIIIIKSPPYFPHTWLEDEFPIEYFLSSKELPNGYQQASLLVDKLGMSFGLKLPWRAEITLRCMPI